MAVDTDIQRVIHEFIDADGNPKASAGFFGVDSVGFDDGVKPVDASLTAYPEGHANFGTSQQVLYDLNQNINTGYNHLVFAIDPTASSLLSGLFGVTTDGMVFFKGLTQELLDMTDAERSWTLRVFVGTKGSNNGYGKVDYIDIEIRQRTIIDQFIYEHIPDSGVIAPYDREDFIDVPGVRNEKLLSTSMDEETPALDENHPGFNPTNGILLDLTEHLDRRYEEESVIFALDPDASDTIKEYFSVSSGGQLHFIGPSLDYETIAAASTTGRLPQFAVKVYVASIEISPTSTRYLYEGELDVVTINVLLRDIDEDAPRIVREDVPAGYDPYDPGETLTRVLTNTDDPSEVLYDLGIKAGSGVGAITWSVEARTDITTFPILPANHDPDLPTTLTPNTNIYFKVDDEGKVYWIDTPTKLTLLNDNFDDAVGVTIIATDADGNTDSVDLAFTVIPQHYETDVLVNRSDLLSATAEDGVVLIDLNTLYEISYDRFHVYDDRFSISDVVGSEYYGILKFTGEHLPQTNNYEVVVGVRSISTSNAERITINVRLDGGDAVYTIGTTGADIRNPYVGDVLSFTRTQTDPDGHNANVAETQEWFYADAPETTLATTPTYTIKAADLGKQIQLRVRYDDRFGAEGDEISPTKDVATAIATGVVSAIGATAPYLETSAREISIPQSIAGIATAQSFTITDADTTAFTASSFTITGTQSSKFEIRQVNSEWRLALKPEQELDFTDADAYTLSVHVTDEGGRASNSVDIVVSGAYYHVTGDGYDALARVVHVGDVLTAQQNYDAPTAPSGTRTYQWFHTDAPATAIGTAQEYTLQAADAGKQVQLRVTYTDAAGTHDSITLPPTTYVSASITASVPHLAVVGAPSVSIEDYLDGHVTEKTFIITDNNFDDRFSEESFTISGTQASKFKFEIRQSGQSNTIEWHLALKDGQWLTLDDGSQFTLSITVTDRDGHTSNSVDVLVSVQNTNHNAPVLSASNPTPTPITEGVAGVDSGYVFTYTDADSNNKFRFDIDGAAADKFEIVQDGAVWKLKLHDGKSLDYETDAVDGKVALEVKLNDGANDSNVVEVEIAVTNINDNAPEFPSTAYVINVVDDTPINTELFRFDATDLDGSALTYTPAPGSTIGRYLTLDADSGTLSLAQAMPTTYVHSFHIWVSDGKGSDSASVTVNSVRNTQPPSFAQATYTAAIGEDAVLGAEVFRLAATDGDVGTILTYSLVSVVDGNGVTFSGEAGLANARNPFAVDARTGAITLKSGLDYENVRGYVLVVKASDGNTDADASAQVSITVNNIEEGPATYSITRSGGGRDAPTPGATLHARRDASDPDGYAFQTAYGYEWFHVDTPDVVIGDANSYQVQTSDVGEQLRFRLKYRDAFGKDEAALSTEATISGIVRLANGDVIALVPSATSANIGENQVGANTDITFTIYDGTEHRFAPDDFQISGDQAGKFEIRVVNGAFTLALKPEESLNYEEAGSLTLNVAVSHGENSSSATALTINVDDINEVASYGFADTGSAHDAPEPYLTLTAIKITDDGEGHNGAEIYEWFHVSAPDVVLGMGRNYEVQESDVGAQLRFRVKYSDNVGNDEAVIGGTSSMVVASGLGLTASATSASITENIVGAISNIILTPTLNDAPIPALTADNFTISGDQADKFEIREVNSAFTLALKPRESLNYETADSLTLNVVLNHDGSKHPAPALTINVANLDEGAASYFIDNTEPTIYTTLTARQSTNDPDERNLGFPQTYEWFYVKAPDTVIHTGETYQVQFSDLRESINFRVKYRDEGGKDEVVEANTATAVVRIKNVDLGASATSATIDENSAGAFSDISFAPTIDGVLIKEDVRAITSLRVSGGGDRFEIVRDGAVWKLKLKPTEALNFEATSGDIALNVIITLNGHQVAAPLPVTISVGDVFEGDLGASATSATIDENIAGAFSGITFTPALNGVAFAPNRVGLNINDDTIGADRFEIVLDGAVWKLKLKATEMFDFETNSDDIILNVVFSLDGEVQGAPLPITISIGNVDEGHETLYLITPGDGRDSPDVGTVLYAQRSHKPFRIDPDGHDESVPEIFEWFHVGTPDVVIGTGAGYNVQEGDVGEQIRFRAKYRDLSGTDEVVISSERSISGVVVPARLVLGESATSGTINENEAGAFSDITFAPLHNNVDITANINANSFYISSDQVHNFVIGQKNGAWALKLSNNEVFDAETATTSTFNIKVQLLYGADISFVDLTVNIGNVDEGDARYFIAPGLGRDHPEPGTILTAQRDARPSRQDPDGYDDSVPVVIEWFHVDSPDVVIGTGENYTVQNSDVGEQIRFRAKYRDGSKTDEVVLSSDGSISGVVAVNLLTLTLSATSTTINENSAGAVSDLTLTPGLGDIAITLTSDSFRISGDAEASKFRVAQNGGVWKLKLKTGMTLDAEATSSINLNIGINESGNTSAIQTLTVNVGNVDEGRETPYFIAPGAGRDTPEVGTELTAQRSTNQSKRDPDGHDDSVADQFEWFHVDSPDAVIGTGRTYTVQTSDVGEQLRFRATYRDLSGTDEVVLANAGSISGVVRLDGGELIALTATATTASIEENAAGASTDIEFSVYDGGEHGFTSTDFTITGAESEHFEVARNQAGNWHLRLIDGHALDYETTTSLTLQVRVSDGTNQSNAINNIVISVIDQANEPVLLATLDLAAIYENHPIDKIIASIETPANLASAGGARLALASTGTNDNALFRLDAGKLYWKSAPDFETPQDADSDNNYEIDIIFTASDGTKYLQKHTLNTQDIGPGRHGYDATAKPDGGFGAYTLPYENVPQEARPIGLASYIIDGYAKIMPDTGPLIFTWSLDANSLYGASEVRVYLDEAFDAFEKAANLKFIEVASDSDIVINFQNRGTTGALGEAHPYITPMAINYYLNDKSDFEGTGFYRTLTHEIGHVLGLKHPFEDSAASTSWLLNLGYMNNDNTMMSYANAFGFIARGTPLLSADVAALQFLYGAPGGDGGDSAERFLKFEANRDYIHAVSERSVDWHPAKLIEISDALAIGTAFYNALHADTLSRLQSQISSIEYKSSTYTIDSTHGDAAFFEISESGAISLKQNLDADTPQDNYGSKAYVENNVYEIKINAVHIYKISSGGMHRSEDYGYLGIEVVDAANIVPLTLTLSATSTTINENSDGAVSDITLTPALDGTPITTLTADNFAIIGSEAYKFEVAPDAQNGGVWKLKLKTGESFDAETDTSPIGLNLFIYQNEKVSAIHTLTINVGNVDEGGETPYFIDNTNNVREAPEPGTILTAQRSTDRSKRDPDGHDNSVPDQFEWFHIDSPDVVIGTGKTYTVQTSDVGEQLRFRVTYRDLSGTDEMVLANAGSISGVVTLDGTARIALVASATTASIEENSAGVSTDIEFSVYDGGEHDFSSTDFTITGTESEHFEIARNQAGNWHLRLIDGHALNYESAASLTLQVRVSDGTNQSNSIDNITINVSNHDEGDATIAITGADVDVGTQLGITYTEDPDGLMAGTTLTYSWFYARDPDPDTSIGTGTTYTIKEDDRGEYIGVRVSYTDKLGAQQVVEDINEDPVPHLTVTTSAPEEDNTIDAHQDQASKIEAGDGADTITGGSRNDVIDGGLGDDVIDLGTTPDDADQVVYGIGDQTAADGGDHISGFNRGKDKFIFSLESNDETNKIQNYDDFLDYLTNGTPGNLRDDQFLVQLDVDYPNNEVNLEGIYLHFLDSTFFSGGRISMPFINIKFAEALDLKEIIEIFGTEMADIEGKFNPNGILMDLDYFDDLLGGDGFIGYEIV